MRAAAGQDWKEFWLKVSPCRELNKTIKFSRLKKIRALENLNFEITWDSEFIVGKLQISPRGTINKELGNRLDYAEVKAIQKACGAYLHQIELLSDYQQSRKRAREMEDSSDQNAFYQSINDFNNSLPSRPLQRQNTSNDTSYGSTDLSSG